MDISQLTNELLQLLALVALAVAIAAARKLATLMGIHTTAAQATTMDTIASNALDWAIARAGSAIKAKGWDHPDVKSDILRAALNYAQDNADAGLKKAGIDTSSRLASADALAPVLERSFSDAMAKAAASPATPVVPVPAVPVMAIGDATLKVTS